MVESSLGVTTAVPEDLVEVLAGTDMSTFKSNGNTLPQIKTPWGFNDWVPQTTGFGAVTTVIDGGTWFNRQDSSFLGMRCSHQPSPWLGNYGTFLITPHVVKTPGLPLRYNSLMSTFKPYLFKTTLKEEWTQMPITLELTPTSRAALVRVTFPAGAQSGHLTFAPEPGFDDYMDMRGGKLWGSTDASSGGTPAGWRMFYALSARTQGAHWSSPRFASPTSGLSSERSHATLRVTRPFPSREPLQLELEIATSFISREQAWLNLKNEVSEHTFDQVVERTRSRWHGLLSRAQVTMASEAQLRIFYTNLWKAMLFPRFLHEINAAGERVHFSPYTGKVAKGRLVADSGFWDAYHTVYPLQSVLFPDIFGTQVDGWLSAYREAGWLPTWASPGQRACMVGTMGDVTLADAIVKSKLGIVSGFNLELAYKAIRKDAFDVSGGAEYGRQGLREYVRRGYLPEAKEDPPLGIWQQQVPWLSMRHKHLRGSREDDNSTEQWDGGSSWDGDSADRSEEIDRPADAIRKVRSPEYPHKLPFWGNINPLAPFAEGWKRRGGTGLPVEDDEQVGTEEAVTQSMNYYVADAAIANAAMALGLTSDSEVLKKRSRMYSRLFNKASLFFQPKDALGKFRHNFDRLAWRNGFTEGNAWHYRFYVPHDVEGLKDLYGGQLCDKVRDMFTTNAGQAFHPGGYEGTIHEMSEAASIFREFGQYNHCNQPSHEVLWIAKKAGCHNVADKYLRKVMDMLYTKSGWCGDEDNGEMASWYVLSALGLYSLEGGKDELVLGSPAVIGATVQLPHGRKLDISTANQGPQQWRVKSVTWQPVLNVSRPVTGSTLRYSEVMAGGKLHFAMAPA